MTSNECLEWVGKGLRLHWFSPYFQPAVDLLQPLLSFSEKPSFLLISNIPNDSTPFNMKWACNKMGSHLGNIVKYLNSYRAFTSIKLYCMTNMTCHAKWSPQASLHLYLPNNTRFAHGNDVACLSMALDISLLPTVLLVSSSDIMS